MDTFRALLVFGFIFFRLAHIEQKFPKLRGFVTGEGYSWTVLVGGALCLHCFSVALCLNKNISAGKHFEYVFEALLQNHNTSVPILAVHDPGWWKCCDNTLTAWGSESHSAFENSPFQHLMWRPLLIKTKMTVLTVEKGAQYFLLVGMKGNIPSLPKCQSTFPPVKHEVVSTAMVQWDNLKSRKENGTVWLKNSKDVVCLRCETSQWKKLLLSKTLASSEKISTLSYPLTFV